MCWEENVRQVLPYTPGEQPKGKNIIKLNTNENPYPPSSFVKNAMENLNCEEMRLYPDPAAEGLVGALADYYGLKKEQIFVGVGSDDVLAMAFLTFFNGKKPVFFPDITYSFYDVWANLFQIPYEIKPLRPDFSLEKEDYMGDCGGIIFPNPNAPTGLFTDISLIEEILQANRGVIVIVDEAYIDFGGESCLPLIKKYENLLIVRTFSKSRSLAGLRIGFAMGNEKVISCLQNVKFAFNSYTMDLPALCLGTASLSDDVYFKETVGKIIETREWTKKELRRLGFSFPDSLGNFVFATHRRIPAKELFLALRKEGIYVRYFEKPRIDNYLRITIGTDAQMERLFSFLENYVKKRPLDV